MKLPCLYIRQIDKHVSKSFGIEFFRKVWRFFSSHRRSYVSESHVWYQVERESQGSGYIPTIVMKVIFFGPRATFSWKSNVDFDLVQRLEELLPLELSQWFLRPFGIAAAVGWLAVRSRCAVWQNRLGFVLLLLIPFNFRILKKEESVRKSSWQILLGKKEAFRLWLLSARKALLSSSASFAFFPLEERGFLRSQVISHVRPFRVEYSQQGKKEIWKGLVCLKFHSLVVTLCMTFSWQAKTSFLKAFFFGSCLGLGIFR